MRRFALSATAVIAASLLLAGCATADEPQRPQGPNGFTLAAALGEGYQLWWDRSRGSGLTDLIVTGPEGGITGSCLGMPGELCFVGPQDNRIGILVADPEAERGVLHFYGSDVELVAGDGPGDEDPSVFAVLLPSERPNPDAGYSIELFDATGAAVPET